MEKLLELLQEIEPNIDFSTEKSIIDDGLIDSLEVIKIIVAISDTFNIEIDGDEIDPDNFQSVDTMWAMIQKIRGN